MGAEYLIIATAAIGGIAFFRLIYLICMEESRPFALPTLLLSCAVGGWFAFDKPRDNLHLHFAIGFLLGSILFGLHAVAIKILLKKSKAASK